jgi:hypothetical protein
MLEPGEVEIPPGGKQDIQVVFKAEGNASYKAVAGISISERDFADQPAGIAYELGGESCIPGELLAMHLTMHPRTSDISVAF